jgi:hypothetical protein
MQPLCTPHTLCTPRAVPPLVPDSQRLSVPDTFRSPVARDALDVSRAVRHPGRRRDDAATVVGLNGMDLVTLVTARAVLISPSAMHALIWQQSGGEPWSFSAQGESQRQVHSTMQVAIRKVQTARPDGSRTGVGLTGLSIDPRSTTGAMFTLCTASAVRGNGRELGWSSALFPVEAPTPDRESVDVPNRDRSADGQHFGRPYGCDYKYKPATSRRPVCAEINGVEAAMVGLGMLRRTSNIVARLKVAPGRGDDPTDRWQDKSREVRRARSAQERREISHLPRGACSHRSLSISATLWTIETSCTSRASHS